MHGKLRMTHQQHARLLRHLFPSDGREAVAVVLCGRRNGGEVQCLMIQEIHEIPYGECATREREKLVWLTGRLAPLLDIASKKNMAVLKVHSHPTDIRTFSSLDDSADRDLFASVFGWMESGLPHASAVMLPDGRLIGRMITAKGDFLPISLISVVGDDVTFWRSNTAEAPIPRFTARHAQAFGRETTRRLMDLTVAVVGCSGTGSPLIEQLVRLGVGGLVLVDPDKVESKNLNRIVHATMEDAKTHRHKVHVIAREIERMGLGAAVVPIADDLASPESVKAVAECDVVFGCMDGSEGRHMLNRLTTFYLLPYFDAGVKLEANKKTGAIEQVCGGVHYLQPGGSSLLSRGVITTEDIRAEGLKRTNPTAYRRLRMSKYIKGVREDRPAVISVNFHYASLAVLDFLARLHPYRNDGNKGVDHLGSTLTENWLFAHSHPSPCPALARHVGRGDVRPLLEMPELSEREMQS